MIWSKLMAHQIKISEFCSPKLYSGIFGEYGIGKTLSALHIIQQKRLKRILVISTKTAIESTWVDEVLTHTDFKYAALLGTKRNKITTLNYGVKLSEDGYTTLFLVNFDGVKNIEEEIRNSLFDLVIVDESTKMKAINALRTKVLLYISPFIRRRIIMTGFPATESLLDLYAQIKFLDGGKALGTSYYSFINRYFIRVKHKLVPTRSGIQAIMTAIKPFCIRVSNKMLALPPKVYKVQKIQPTSEQLDLFKQLDEEFRVTFKNVKYETQYIFAVINKYLQICNGFIQDAEGNVAAIKTNKDEALLDLIFEIDPNKNKILIWTAFLHSVKKIKLMLQKYGINVLTVTGATENVNAVINKFQNSSNHNVMIATQKKASASITLTKCAHAIYYSNTWSQDERGNSEARIYRKGSEIHKFVSYTDFITTGSIESKVYKSLRYKKKLVDLLKTEFGDLT